MAPTISTDCPKFLPNIFNKSKCSQCFHTREEHRGSSGVPSSAPISSRGLGSSGAGGNLKDGDGNHSGVSSGTKTSGFINEEEMDAGPSKTIIRYGYLFIAPVNFTAEQMKNKRWQRRWFALYEDGELSYSLDEHPNALPQGTIDMKSIVQISPGDELTQNQYCIYLRSEKDENYFLKCANNEDYRGWFRELGKYNRVIFRGNTKTITAANSPCFPSGSGSMGISGTYQSSYQNHGHGFDQVDGRMVRSLSLGADQSSALTSSSPTPSAHTNNHRTELFVRQLSDLQPSSGKRNTVVSFSRDQVDSTMSTTQKSTKENLQNVFPNNSTAGSSKRGKDEVGSQVPPVPIPRRTLEEIRNLPSSGSTNPNQVDSAVQPEEIKKVEPKTIAQASKTYLLRGDPDGCGSTQDCPGGHSRVSSRAGWLLQLEADEKTWTKNWFSIHTNTLLIYKTPETSKPMTQLTLTPATTITKYDDENGKYFPFLLKTETEALRLSAITNGIRTIWINALKTGCEAQGSEADTSNFLQKLSKTKSFLTDKKAELSKLQLVKSQSVQIDKLSTELNSGFLEIEKLEFEHKKLLLQLQNSEAEIEQLKRESSNSATTQFELNILREENRLLTERLNDLTEKFYNSEKNSKALKQRLQRHKSQSLKEKQIEVDIHTKIQELESKMSLMEPMDENEPGSGGSGEAPPTPTGSKPSSGLINVVLKLNELDKRLEKAEWYKGTCTNCEILCKDIQDRDEKLVELEDRLNELEDKFTGADELREKYLGDVESVQRICSNTLEKMEASYKRLVSELEEKHAMELQQIQIEKERALAEETQATLSALEALRKNHEIELIREMTKFREEFLTKYRLNENGLEAIRKEHEEDLADIHRELLQLTEKYTTKCVECCSLEEELEHISTVSQATDSSRPGAENK